MMQSWASVSRTTNGRAMPWHRSRWILYWLWGLLVCDITVLSAGSDRLGASSQFPSQGPPLSVPDSVCSDRSRALANPMCECRHTMNQLLMVNCSSRSMVSLPGNMPYNTSILFLQQNGIREIANFAFQSTPNIIVLFLHDNELHRIENQSLHNLQQLRIINLAGNPIKKISHRPFVLLPQLREIVLTDTPLQCGCDELQLRQWARRRDVILSGAVCRNLNLKNLRTIDKMTYFRNCDDYEQRCYQCNEHSVEHCFQPHRQVSCSGGKVCGTSVSVHGGFPTVTAGCQDVASCVGETNANTHFCRSGVFDVECNFCCAGNRCQRNLQMNDVQFLADYQLTFDIRNPFDSLLRVDSSPERRSLSRQVVRELNLVFSNVTGTFEVVVNSFNPGNQSGVTRVDVVIKARLDLNANLARVRDDLTKALVSSIAEQSLTITIIPSSIDVTVEGVCASSRTDSAEHGEITWSSTFEGKVGQHQCPWDPDGDRIAQRQCMSVKGSAHWGLVDYSGCQQITDRFKLLANMSSIPITEDTVRIITAALVNATQRPASLKAKEVHLVAETIDHIVGAEDLVLDERSAGYILSAVCNLLRVDLATLVASELLYGASSSLLRRLDGLAHRMAPLDSGRPMHFQESLLQVAIERAPKNPGHGVVFKVDPDTERIVLLKVAPSEDPLSDLTPDASLGSIALPPEAFHGPRRRNSNMQFALYANDNFFKAVTLARRQPTTQEDAHQLHLEERPENKVNSRVISASLAPTGTTHLTQPAAIALRHETWRMTTGRCVFWNLSLHHGRGDWSSKGMILGSVLEDAYTVCYSDHLTNFALLMDIYGEGISLSSGHQRALSVISYIGCAISLIGLALTLFTYLNFKQLRKDNPSKILVNLCGALFLLVLLFLIASSPAVLDSPPACKLFGFLLHYVALAALGWMCVEALYMYLALVRVFQTYYAKFHLKCAALGWGIPFVIAIITICASTDNYGPRGNLCWLGRTAFFSAFLPPVCLALGFNFAIFGLVIKQLYSFHSSRADNKKFEYTQIAVRIRGACSIVVLLGLTWVFGFFAIGGAGVVFQYLFALCNSLQGLFIFIFYCVLKKEVKFLWMRLLPCFDVPPDAATSSSRAPTGATVLLTRGSVGSTRHSRRVSQPLHTPSNATRTT